MKRTIRYPIAFDTVLPRHREAKTVIAFVEGEVEVPELPSSAAPVAIRVSDVDQIFGQIAGTEYRVHDDRLLVDTGMRPEEFGVHETNSIDKRSGLILPALEEMRKEFAEGLHIHPPKALIVIGGLLWNGAVPTDFRETWEQMSELGKTAERFMDEDRARTWTELTARHAATFAVIGGTVWKQTAEPCYTVDRTRAPGLTTRPANFYDTLRCGHMDSSRWNHFRSHGRNFSALDRERAYRHGRRAALAGRFDDQTDLPRIDLSSVDLPLMDFDACEFERVSRLLVYDVADSFRKIAHGKGVDMFLSGPREVMDRFMDARDCLPDMDARVGITLEQELAMQGLLNVLNHTSYDGQPFLTKMNLVEVNEVFDDWLSREVSLDSMVSLPLPGGRK
jgi:hypothetical protein